MPIEVTMPRLSDTMEQGTIVKWNVKEGDSVASGDVIADVETDKATMELQTFDAGTVSKLSVGEGQTVPVGTTIAVILEEGEQPSADEPADKAERQEPAVEETDTEETDASDKKPSRTDARPEAPPEEDRSPAEERPDEHAPPKSAAAAERSTREPSAPGRVFVSPLARKLAEESGIDLSRVDGSGPGGRIVRKDVEAAASAGPTGLARRDVERATTDAAAMTRAMPVAAAPLPAPGAALESRLVPLSNMRATIARRLVQSKTTIPHYQVSVSARVDNLLTLREQLNEQLAEQGVKLSVNDFLVRACALAMHRHPYVNASWVEPEHGGQPAVRLHGDINIGVAIALPAEKGGGLVVATLRSADSLGLRHISLETRRLAEKARTKGLTVEEMADSTFTISNLGMFGVDHFTAIINPPNAAILAVGQAIKRPFVEESDDGEAVLVVGHELTMTMSSDHRVIDGAMAAQYLSTVKSYLENPATLLV